MTTQKLHRKPLLTASVVGALLAVTTGPASAGIIVFEEDFANDTGSNQDLSTADPSWQAHLGENAEALGEVSGNTNTQIGGGEGPDGNNGFVFFWPGNSNPVDRGLIWTETTIERTPLEIERFTFDINNDVEEATWQVAIRIGSDDWFVTTDTVGTPSEDWFADEILFSTDASAWLELNFDPDTDLSAGDALTDPLPSGDITAFGMFANAMPAGETQRFDNFTVETVIPEPASLALLGLGGMLMLQRRRR